MTFEEAYRAYYQHIKGYMARKFSRSGLDMDDVAQEGFTAAWSSWAKHPENVFRWLVGITLNVARRMLRDAKLVTWGGGIQHIEWNAEADHRADMPEQEAAFTMSEAINKVTTLSPLRRKVMAAYMSGLNTTDIASMEHISHQAASKAVREARHALRKII